MQARNDPDFLQPKKFKGSSSSANLLGPDFSSGDDSKDEDFELVARPKPAVTAKNATTYAADQSPTEEETKAGSGTSDVEDSDDEEQFLANVLVRLKKENSSNQSNSKQD